jgi:hypothetical protein
LISSAFKKLINLRPEKSSQKTWSLKMNESILGIYYYSNTLKVVRIFGHTGHGIPGLEILGLSKGGRTLVEKFHFLTKRFEKKIPLRRYVICLEQEGRPLTSAYPAWLELPLLLLYWKMAGILPIGNLEDCFTGGKVGVDGKIKLLDFGPQAAQSLISNKKAKYIGVPNVKRELPWKVIPLFPLLKTPISS